MLDERDLARKALSLRNSKDMQEILLFMSEAQLKLGNTHAVIQLMAHKLRNLAVPNPESTSMIRCERIVTNMADVEEEHESQSYSGSATPTTTLSATITRPVQPITVYDRCRAKGAGR